MGRNQERTLDQPLQVMSQEVSKFFFGGYEKSKAKTGLLLYLGRACLRKTVKAIESFSRDFESVCYTKMDTKSRRRIKCRKSCIRKKQRLESSVTHHDSEKVFKLIKQEERESCNDTDALVVLIDSHFFTHLEKCPIL